MQKREVELMKVHLAILYKDYLNLILEEKKTMEARFSKVKGIPFGKVNKGDKILLKETGGPVRGEAIVKDVKYFENLTQSKIIEIVNLYREELQIQDDFLQQKIDSKYLTLIFLENVIKVSPYHVNKKDRRGWVLWDSNNSSKYLQLSLLKE